MPVLEVIGVPTSAGAHHAGQELAPAALRARGLVDALREQGLEVRDSGDLPGAVFRRDTRRTAARGLDDVVRVATEVAAAVERSVRTGRVPLVLGGDCTIELGVVAGVLRVHPDAALAYFDGDADLSSPSHPGSGVLDASGVAHLIGAADDALARIGAAFPMLTPDRLALIGFDPDDPDAVDETQLARWPAALRVDGRTLAADPEGAVRRAVGELTAGGAPAVVHFDVDAIDSADLPLANFPHYGAGQTLAVAERVLAALVGIPGLAAITLTEVNPTHDPGGDELDRYVAAVARAIGSALR